MKKIFAFFAGLFGPGEQEMIARALRSAGYEPIDRPLYGRPVGELNGAKVALSFFIDNSQASGRPRYFVGVWTRLAVEVDGVDLTCHKGPHIDLALAWAKGQAAEYQARRAAEEAAALKTIGAK